MKPQDWFGVGVRLFALYPLMLAVQQFVYVADLRLGLSSTKWYGQSGEFHPIDFLFHGFIYVLFAIALLRAAPMIVSFAYPGHADEPDTEPSREPNGDNVVST